MHRAEEAVPPTSVLLPSTVSKKQRALGNISPYSLLLLDAVAVSVLPLALAGLLPPRGLRLVGVLAILGGLSSSTRKTHYYFT